MDVNPLRFTALLATAIALLALLPAGAKACDACNNAFLIDLFAKGGESLVGRDLLRTIHNQKNLPLARVAATSVAALSPTAQLTQVDLKPGRGVLPGAPPSRTAPPRTFDSLFKGAEFIEIIRRDEGLSIPATGFVPQHVKPDKEFTIELNEGRTYIGQGVMYDGFLTNGAVPGPTIIVQEGDIVRMNIVNTGSVPHGASIHAAYTQTAKYVGNIQPGETKSVTFRATVPGVYMYHCAPGGHAIAMHVKGGQYGMIVVEPKKKYRLEKELGRGPDLTLYLLQHEFYASGKDGIEGKALYTAFNGQVFRYVEEPITAKPGDYVRVYLLNVGPNLLSTFHLVGIIWDYVYWQGHPEAWWPNGQTVTAGPSDSWVIEFRVPPDEGVYVMLSHAVGATSRGSIGLLVADRNAKTPKTILAEGPRFTAKEIEEKAAKAVRTIAPFKPAPVGTGAPAVADLPAVFGPDVKEVTVRIIGNSFYPKVIEIEPGTKVTWVNEEAFTYLAGEVSGIHNAVGISGPTKFATRMLGHAEKSDSVSFTEPGSHEYMCAPHPYMRGKIIVRESASGGLAGIFAGPTVLLIAVLALIVGLLAAGLAFRSRRPA